MNPRDFTTQMISKTKAVIENSEVSMGIVICPVCKAPADSEFKRGTIRYHQCDTCDTIYTKDDISSVVQTENDNPSYRNTEHNHLIRLTRIINEHKDFPKTAIDFGCGDGKFTEFLSNALGYAVGIDLNTKVQLSDLRAEAYDVVTMVEVIEHLAQPAVVLAELQRKLRVNGIAYIETTFADQVWSATTHPYIDPCIGHRTILSRRGLQLVAQEAGFSSPEFLNPNVAILRRV